MQLGKELAGSPGARKDLCHLNSARGGTKADAADVKHRSLVGVIDYAKPRMANRSGKFTVLFAAIGPPMGDIMDRIIVFAAVVVALMTASAHAQTSLGVYANPEKPNRVTYTAERTNRGTTTPIPIKVIEKLCGDADGCELRLGMHNWDDTGRIASRSSLFYYNKQNRNWRAEVGDPAGTDANNVIQHAFHAWACYFTDGAYAKFVQKGDAAVGFGLLSWTEFNADCVLTIID